MPQLYNARRFGVPLDDFPTLTRTEANAQALPAFEAARPERRGALRRGLPRRSLNCRRLPWRHSVQAGGWKEVIVNAAFGEREGEPAAPGGVNAPAARIEGTACGG